MDTFLDPFQISRRQFVRGRAVYNHAIRDVTVAQVVCQLVQVVGHIALDREISRHGDTGKGRVVPCSALPSILTRDRFPCRAAAVCLCRRYPTRVCRYGVAPSTPAPVTSHSPTNRFPCG